VYGLCVCVTEIWTEFCRFVLPHGRRWILKVDIEGGY